VSPVAQDDFAEYRDSAFLAKLGLGGLAPMLQQFWPRRGPQWDALGVLADGCVLAEAKAHLTELVSPPTQASPTSRKQIAAAFDQVKTALGVAEHRDWTAQYYQVANRIAHLWFLRHLGVNAHLVLVDFLGDDDMGGPAGPSEWVVAYQKATEALGLPETHLLSDYIHHVFPSVHQLDRAA
jgi:hypothetical protein